MIRIAYLFMLTFALGCGSAKTAPVAGTVTLDGAPVAKGTIIFESPGNRPATGQIEDGQIVNVTTFEPGDGVPMGEHKVAVSIVEEAASAVTSHPSESGGGMDPNYMGGKSLIPEKYSDPSTSGLTATITRGENTVSFEVFSKK